MKSFINAELAGVLACIAGSVSAQAANTTTTGVTPSAKMSCEDFIALDDVVKPKVVYWMEGISRKGKPETAYVDIEETDRLVPVLIEDCTKAPKESLWKKFKTKVKKII